MNSLPKIVHPKFNAVVPSTNKRIEYRPFTGSEQKALLVAKESDDTRDAIRAMADVVTACSGVKRGEMTPHDMQVLFLMIRAKSVGSVSKVRIADDSGVLRDAEVDIEKMTIREPSPKPSGLVDVGNGITVKLRQPTVEDVLLVGADDEWGVLAACVDSVTVGDDVHTRSDFTHEEMKEWVTGLPMSALREVRDFLESRPVASVTAKYKDDSGIEYSRTLEGISNFFA